MNAQIIEQDGKPAFAVVPFAQWQALLARLEDRDDVADAMAARDAEDLPAALVNKLLDGSEHPLRLWRKHRKLTLAQLAGQVGVTRQMLSMLENGKSRASVALLERLAHELGCDMDDIHPAQ